MATVPDCPDTEVLRRFLLGRFPAGQVEGLAGHVESCARCVRVLNSLKDSDAVLDAMQVPPTDRPEPPTELVERLCALRAGHLPTTEVHGGGLLSRLAAASAETTQELYDFLAPPEAAEELGRLGPYRAVRVLGAGGMGVVFEAEDTVLKRRVALKALRPALAASPSARRRFLLEGQAAAALSHEHVVPIYQVGEDRGVPYIAMPLLRGETLEDRLRREGTLPAGEVLRVGRGIAEGLAAAHDKGLIHRDVKPSNIWLETREGEPAESSPRSRVRLLDFGLARAVGGDAHLTQSGVVVGTPAYMAPEQARGEAVDPRTDLFGLGCVLYRACTGRVPFPGSNALATLLALAQGSPTPPARCNPRLPPGLSELVMKLLAPRPAGRYPTAGAVVEALNAVADGKAPAGRRVPRVVAGAAVAVLVGVLAAVGTTTLPRPPRGKEGDGPPSAGAPAELFAPAVAYPAGLYPKDVVVADFNGDGKPDLAVANLNSHSVSVLLGNGDGTFRAPLTSSAGEMFAASLAVGDLDGDGKPDLVVMNTGVHEISVMLGRGDGTFLPPVLYGAGTNPTRAVIADLNGDGKPDLAVLNGGGDVSVLLGNGDGTFRPAVNYAAGVACMFLVTADLDRDGHLDLAVAGNDGRVTILPGNGDGTFRPGATYTASGPAWGLAVCDVNRDGKPDLAVANKTAGVDVLLGNGDGTFRAVDHPGISGSNYVAVAAADLDGDGWPDLVLANHTGHTVDVLRGDGEGGFREPLTFAVGRIPSALAVGDFNGDGVPDVAVANSGSNSVSILLGRPPPAYHAHLGPPTFYPAGTEPHAVAVDDFDRDGRDDLVVADHAGSVWVLLARDDGTFRDAVSFPAGKAPSALALGDFNDDGKLDLAVTDEAGDAVQVLLGRGDGTFAPPVPYSVGKKPVAVAVGDFDRDGKADLVVTNYDGGTLSVLRGRGDGTFQKAADFPAGPHPRGVTVADVNGDGKPDLLVANRQQVGTVSVLLGRGDGTFAAPVSLSAGAYPVAVVAADFNRDGKLDLAVANWASSDVNVFLGHGDGTFGNPVNYSANDFPLAMAAADIDGDGKLDLVLTGSQYKTACLLRGNGDGTFQPELVYGAGGLSAAGLAVGHFGRGARPAVVTANAHSGNVSVLRNRPAAPYLALGLDPTAIDPAGLTCRLTFGANPAAGRHDGKEAPLAGTVHFSSSDPLAVLPADYTITPEDKKGHALDVTLRTPGSQTVTVTDAAGKLLPCTAVIWVLKPADLRLVPEAPDNLEAGKPFAVTVNVMDPFNGWTPGYGGTIHFQCNDPQARLPADHTFDRVEQLHTFTGGFILPNPGEWTITVSDTAEPKLTARLTVTVRPAKGQSGP